MRDLVLALFIAGGLHSPERRNAAGSDLARLWTRAPLLCRLHNIRLTYLTLPST